MTRTRSIPHPRIPAILGILGGLGLLVTGCAGGGPRSGATAPPSPPPYSLERKAAVWEAAIADRFLSPEGLLLYRVPTGGRTRPADPGAPGPPAYGDLADACIWTGTLLGAEALRYAETGDPTARDRATRVARAMHMLHGVTGVPGLLARSFSYDPGRDPDRVGDPGDFEWHRASDAYPGYVWRGDVSRDQYVGWIFGVGLYLRHAAEEPVASHLRADVRAVAEHVLRNDFRIVGPRGPTTFGDLDAWYGPVPIGVNALLDLAIFKLAARVTGDERYERIYRALIADGLLDAAYWAKFSVLGITNYNNDNMALLSAYLLHVLEDDPAIREELAAGLDRTWSFVRRDRNALFTFIVHAAMDRPPGPALAEAHRILRNFPVRKVVLPVDSRHLAFPVDLLPTRGGSPRSTRALPIHLRKRSSFLWKSSPYALVGYPGTTGARENAGHDYLLAYWLGRHEGFVGPDE